MVHQLLLSGLIISIHMILKRASVQKNQVYCWGIFKSEACKFYRQYLLPCRHIFHCDTEVKLLTAMQWEVYLMIFAECGMEVYEAARTVWVEEEGLVDGISRGQTLSVVCGKASSRYNSSSMLHMS